MKRLLCLLAYSYCTAFADDTNLVIRFIAIDGTGTNTVQFVLPPDHVQAILAQYASDGATNLSVYFRSVVLTKIADGLEALKAAERPYPVLTNKVTGAPFSLRSLDDAYGFKVFAEKYGLSK